MQYITHFFKNYLQFSFNCTAACSVTEYIASLLGRWECRGGKKAYDLLESQSKNKCWECEEKCIRGCAATSKAVEREMAARRTMNKPS